MENVEVKEIVCNIIIDSISDHVLREISDPDWAQIIYFAKQNNLAPLLYWHLRDSKEVPIEFMSSLQSEYHRTVAHNMLIVHEFQKVVESFVRNHIPVLLLKGISLSVTSYPDLGLRPMGDIDILVPSDRFIEAERELRTIGYVEESPDPGHGIKRLLDHDIHLVHPNFKSVLIDLHWTIVATNAYNYAVPIDWFWTQTKPIRFSDQLMSGQVLIFSPEAQILHTASHAMLQHGGGRSLLIWYYDLHLVLSNYKDNIDWQLICSKAKEFGWMSALYSAIKISNKLFGTDFPENLESINGSILKNSVVERKEREFVSRTDLNWRKFQTLNWSSRILLLQVLVFPSFEYMCWRYKINNRLQIPFFYIYRWIVIFVDILKTIFSRLS